MTRAVASPRVVRFGRATGLLRVTPGEGCSEDGFDCHDEAPVEKGGTMPALEIGTLDAPIPANVRAVIRLTYFEGMNRETLPRVWRVR